MTWTNSKIFRPFIADVLGNVAALDLDADSFKIALYNNSITPDNDVTSANSAYNVSVWATAANEIFEAGQWAQGGVVLTGVVLNSATADTVYWDANDPASGTAADLAAVTGALFYDDTIASPVVDQGVCYNYFGGSNSVVNGTFTVLIPAPPNGIAKITL